MTGGTATVGVLLVAPLALLGVEVFGYLTSPFGQSSFWSLPLDDKLERISRHGRAWWLIHLTWFPTLAVMTAGLAGLAFLLGEPVGWAAFGGFALAATAWLLGVANQAASMSVAAEQWAETGETPPWAAAWWRAGYSLEGVWIVLGNLAFVGYGAALLGTDLLPNWLGWAAIGVGLAMPIVVLLTRDGFPQMVLPVPLALGIALLVS